MSEIFNITHEAGNLNEYDSTSTDGGDLSATAAAALASTSYGLSVLIDDTNNIYGHIDITATDEIRIRFYIDPNSASTNNGYYTAILVVRESTTSAYALYLAGDGSAYTLTLYAIEDSGSWGKVVNNANLSNSEHYLEMHFKAATGAGQNNGIAKLWIDGVYADGSESIDNDTRANAINVVRVGARDISNFNGTIYIDEITANDDGNEIGPLSSSIAIFRRRLEKY